MEPEQPEKIPFEQWQKLDLRVAKILEVKNHPNADKLYCIEIDLGTEKKRVVAGLKQHYTPEELTGRLCIVCANLQPAVIRGIESQGMILAAASDESLVILSPEKDIAPGSKIR